MRSRVMSDSGISSDSNETDLYTPNFYLQEKIRSLEIKLNDIISAKAVFLGNYITIHENIENIVRHIFVLAEAREQTLKSLLQKIANSKIPQWDRQLNLCKNAEANMRNTKNTIGEIQEIARRFAEEIGFIDAGDIKFSVENATVWKVLETFGRFSKYPFCLRKSSEKPRFVLGGTANERFNRPWGVCSDSTGRILVVDSGNNRIQVFNEFCGFLFRFGKSGTEPGEFDRPTGIVVDNKFRILVSDKDNHRIQVFTFTGGFLLSFGEKGTAAGQFLHPWDVTVNENDEIAVSDTRNHRIQLFNHHGGFISQFTFGVSPSLSFCPRGVAFKPDGSLLVTDFYNHSVCLIDKDFTASSEFRRGNFYKPQGIACNSWGVFAIADGRNNIQVFDEFGNLCWRFGERRKKPGQFDCVQGICFQPDGGIAVADFGNNSIQIF